MTGVLTLDSLKKNIENFNKMLAEESSELIKISYWGLVEQQFKSYREKNGDAGLVELIFSSTFSRNIEVLKTKNLFFLIINFLRTIDYESFVKFYFLFVTELIRNYPDTRTIFNDFLFEFTFTVLVDNRVQHHTELIRSFFQTFFEVDQSLAVFRFVQTINISSNIEELLVKNQNFQFIIKEYFQRLVRSHNFQFLNILLSSFYNLELKLIVQISLKDQKNYSNLKLRDENLLGIIIFMASQIKCLNLDSIENFHDYAVKQAVIYSLTQMFLIIKGFETKLLPKDILEDYLIFLLEFSIQKNVIVVEFFDFFQDFIYLGFSTFNESLMIYIYSVANEIYDREVLDKVLNLVDCLVTKFTSHDYSVVNLVIAKMLFKRMELQNKFKQTNPTKYMMLFEEFNKEFTLKPVEESSVFAGEKEAFSFYKDHERHSNINDLSMLSFILKRTMSSNKKDILLVNSKELMKLVNILFNFNLEKYNQNFKNFAISFYVNLCLLITPNHIEIVQLLIDKLSGYPDKIFVKTSIYPTLIYYLQTTYIDKFPENPSGYSLPIKKMFSLFNEYSKEDSIATIIYKLLTRFYAVPMKTTLNKSVCLELFKDFVLRKNAAKFTDYYFKFILANLKKEANNEEAKYLNYRSLYSYLQTYECALLSDIEQYLTEQLDKKLLSLESDVEASLDIETLFILSSVLEILRKEECKNIVEKLFDCFNNNKLIKVINNLNKNLQSVTSEQLFITIGYLDMTDPLNLFRILDKTTNLSNKVILSVLITKVISHISTYFIRNIIVNNSEQLKDRKNYTTNPIIMQLFKNYDYISGNLIFDSSASTKVSIVIYINEFFSHYENLTFFYNTYTSYKATHLVEENNLDLSLLNQVQEKLTIDNNKKLFEIYTTSKNFALLGDFLNNIFKFETIFFERKESKETTSFVIEDINDSFSSANFEIKIENKQCFSKLFVDNVMQVDDTFSDIQTFLVSDNTLLKYFKQHLRLFNPQFVLIIFYSVIKLTSSNSLISSDVICKNFYSLLSILIKQNKGVFITFFRLLTSPTTFARISPKNIIPNELMNIAELIIKQTIIFNSYKPNILANIFKVLETIDSYVKSSPNDEGIYLSNVSLYCNFLFGLVKFLKEKLSSGKNELELNKKALESILEVVEKTVAKLVNSLIENWRKHSEKATDIMSYFEIVFSLLKFINEEKEEIILLNETPESNTSLISFINVFNEAKDLNKVNIILKRVFESQSSENYFYFGFLLYFRSSPLNNKFASDAIQSLIYNKEFAYYGREKRLKVISTLISYFLLESKVLGNAIMGNEEMALLVIHILHNLPQRLGLSQTLNFPETNSLLD